MVYDVAVIGSGPGGYVAALHGAQMGARVCCIEMKDIGGTCLNRGCIPSKYFIASVGRLISAKRLKEMGVAVQGNLDWHKMTEGKDKVVSVQAKGIETLFKSWEVHLVKGKASFLERTKLLVENEGKEPQEIKAKKTIIASGSSPSSISGMECDGKVILNSDQIFDMKEVPSSILIIGAGAIGCEFACLFANLGCRVTLVEMMPQPLPLEDEEISQTFSRELKKRQVILYIGTRVASLAIKDGRAYARLEGGEEVSADIAIVAAGRKRNLMGLGLERIGLSDIQVNQRMETGVEGIYAVGDIVGKKMLAHVASREGIVAMENALGHNMNMDYRFVPSATFTDPEVASVGLTEKQARKEHEEVNVGKFPFRALSKAHVLDEIAGEVKIVSEGRDGKILGAHIIGPHATELIHELSMAMALGARLRDLTGIIHAHPTLSEAFTEAAFAAQGLAIHLPKRK